MIIIKNKFEHLGQYKKPVQSTPYFSPFPFHLSPYDRRAHHTFRLSPFTFHFFFVPLAH